MSGQDQKRYVFHVHGMHCNACVLMTESALSDLSNITHVKSSLKDHSIEVTGDFGDKEAEHIAKDLSEVLKPHGYSLSLEKKRHAARWSDVNLALPIAGAFIALFFLLQKLGIVNLVTTSNVSYGTAFIIGIIASLSTCMAIVGGLVLSVSAEFAKGSEHSNEAGVRRAQPQILFHVGRLVSFFILGGVMGAVGSAFVLGAFGTLLMGVLIGVILLLLGVNLLDVFPWAKKLQPTLPAFIGRHIHGLKNLNHSLTPVLIGIATFFLPCGFTQSMQLYALTTGSFWTGGMIMLSFALGTLPVLALLSFSSFAIHTKRWSSVFFKTSGLIVIFFGLFNIINSLAGYGIIPPLFNF